MLTTLHVNAFEARTIIHHMDLENPALEIWFGNEALVSVSGTNQELINFCGRLVEELKRGTGCS